MFALQSNEELLLKKVAATSAAALGRTDETSRILALSTTTASSSSIGALGKFDPAPIKNAGLTLAYLTGKVSAMVFVSRLNFITLQVQEMEKDQELSDDIELLDILSPTRNKHELNVWKGFLPKVKLGVFFECNVIGVFHLLETICRKAFSYKTARSLTKQVSASAIRKSARATAEGWTTTELAGKVLNTTFKAQTLYWSALFIVSVSFDAIQSLNGKYAQSGMLALFVPRVKIEGTFWKRTWVNFVDCSKKCFLTALGASIGTLIRPGLGTTVGMVFFPSLAGAAK
jgi:hypothetical protein